MSVDAIGVTTNPAGPPAPAPKQTMDQEFFLALLVAQLQNQDPTNAMDTTDMMNQSVQLSMMEQMVAQTTASQENFALQMRIAAAGMIGQTITYIDADGEPATGTATAVSFAEAVPTITVDGVEVPLDRVAAVTTTSDDPDPDLEGSDQDDNETS